MHKICFYATQKILNHVITKRNTNAVSVCGYTVCSCVHGDVCPAVFRGCGPICVKKLLTDIHCCGWLSLDFDIIFLSFTVKYLSYFMIFEGRIFAIYASVSKMLHHHQPSDA